VRELGRRGAVVAVSGGVDSGVVAALCVEALGPERVVLLRLPERGLSESSSDLALELAQKLGTRSVEEPISAALEALGCYRLQHEAIRRVFPEFEPTWGHKLVRSKPTGGMIVFSLVVQDPDGIEHRRRMPPEPYQLLVAATNMKQRVRKLLEYTWADRLGYAVAGTPNLLEYDQGFFVKGGDGLADVKPIASLYKQQVYALARYLELPDGIAGRAPTTETFTLPQSQEEFYFGHPYDRMDVLLWGESHDVPARDLAPRVGLVEDEVDAAYREIERRRAATAYLHAPARIVHRDGTVS
jgi:NAD+ synthase